jgi:uncharacterized protein
MRNKPLIALVGILAVIGLLAAMSGLPNARAADRQQSTEPVQAEAQRTISVNGSGVVSLTPDIATISIGVRTENADASEAVSSNNSQAAQVMAALESFGIAEEDIQTSNFSIYPRQDYNREGELIGTTYVVDNTVIVKVRDLDQVGAVLDASVRAGANSIGGISFTVEDSSEAYNQALEAAFASARSRAQALASAAGVQLGDVQTISSYVSGGPIPVVRDAHVQIELMAADVPISPGQTDITVEVSVVFAIR